MASPFVRVISSRTSLEVFDFHKARCISLFSMVSMLAETGSLTNLAWMLISRMHPVIRSSMSVSECWLSESLFLHMCTGWYNGVSLSCGSLQPLTGGGTSTRGASLNTCWPLVEGDGWASSSLGAGCLATVAESDPNGASLPVAREEGCTSWAWRGFMATDLNNLSVPSSCTWLMVLGRLLWNLMGWLIPIVTLSTLSSSPSSLPSMSTSRETPAAAAAGGRSPPLRLYWLSSSSLLLLLLLLYCWLIVDVCEYECVSVSVVAEVVDGM
mmetsp:Transcript_1789/g.4414  ORF Transcript_1789/g.4414 Transcript_1789/m.4414 type:complete len:269 (+) Transcript_1789:471-1277(+)